MKSTEEFRGSDGLGALRSGSGGWPTGLDDVVRAEHTKHHRGAAECGTPHRRAACREPHSCRAVGVREAISLRTEP